MRSLAIPLTGSAPSKKYWKVCFSTISSKAESDRVFDVESEEIVCFLSEEPAAPGLFLFIVMQALTVKTTAGINNFNFVIVYKSGALKPRAVIPDFTSGQLVNKFQSKPVL